MEIKAMVYVKMDAKGRITIPKDVRELMKIPSNSKFKLILENGKIIMERIE
jgi:AbrB family looped-hinge helix DNA binding protein